MAVLTIFDPIPKIVEDPKDIKTFMNERGIIFEQWEANRPLLDNDSQETILLAYDHKLSPYMKKHGYLSADVINVHKETPNIEAIRAKFLSEHTHSEDEVRFFVDGEGQFFFHLKEKNEVFKLYGGTMSCKFLNTMNRGSQGSNTNEAPRGEGAPVAVDLDLPPPLPLIDKRRQ
jgi:cupin superfamily acireductone dioxygenase involved in methionine salvage